MFNLFAAMAGGALGAGGRYLISLLAKAVLGTHAFWGTALVNVLGSLVMGAAFAYMVFGRDTVHPASVFLMTGALGGFTTFSAFSLEVLTLVRSGAFGYALFYIAASVGLSILAVAAGFIYVRGL